jgi:hypothetical protein
MLWGFKMWIIQILNLVTRNLLCDFLNKFSCTGPVLDIVDIWPIQTGPILVSALCEHNVTKLV